MHHTTTHVYVRSTLAQVAHKRTLYTTTSHSHLSLKGAQNLQELHVRLRRVMVRRKKEEALPQLLEKVRKCKIVKPDWRFAERVLAEEAGRLMPTTTITTRPRTAAATTNSTSIPSIQERHDAAKNSVLKVVTGNSTGEERAALMQVSVCISVCACVL